MAEETYKDQDVSQNSTKQKDNIVQFPSQIPSTLEGKTELEGSVGEVYVEEPRSYDEIIEEEDSMSPQCLLQREILRDDGFIKNDEETGNKITPLCEKVHKKKRKLRSLSKEQEDSLKNIEEKLHNYIQVRIDSIQEHYFEYFDVKGEEYQIKNHQREMEEIKKIENYFENNKKNPLFLLAIKDEFRALPHGLFQIYELCEDYSLSDIFYQLITIRYNNLFSEND
mgnify:CR=1 FL=1|tara:strand:- start:4262 stop:4936 length:675 start_codon:yes stop_codon:yes gene_type:complete